MTRLPLRWLLAVGLAATAALAVSSATPRAAETSWTRIQHPALRGGGSVVYVNDLLPAAGSASPWLAVGYVVDADGKRTPSAWTSPNGAAWERTLLPPSPSSERRDGVFLVARRGSLAIAIGDRFDNELRPAAWFSSGPTSWSALDELSDPLMAFQGRITAVDAGPDGFVAVGVESFGNTSRVTVFASSTGQGWTVRGTLEPGEFAYPFAVSAASGRIVVVGYAAAGNSVDGRIWVLDADGSWTRAAPGPAGLSGPGDQVVTSVAWNPTNGFVAAGSETRSINEKPVVWTSADALNWAKLPDGVPPSDGGNAAIQRLVAIAGGFLASGASDAGPRVWRSSDGTSWQALSSPPPAGSEGLFVVAASDGATIVLLARTEFGSRVLRRVGSTWVRADGGPAFPKSQAPADLVDVAASGKRVVAVGASSDGRPLVMTSSAGGAWRRAAFPDLAGRLVAITSARGTFWAVGWRLVRGRARLATWTSQDGRRWARRGGTAFEPVGTFVDAAPVPGGVAAVALEPGRRGFVTSAWVLTRAGWRPEGVLGRGEPRAICAGPHGVTAVSVVDSGLRSRVVAWTRKSNGPWPREADLVAAFGASATRCADASSSTVIGGQDGNLGATLWRRAQPGEPWRALVLAQTAPSSYVGDITRDGGGFIAVGSFGGRGQADFAAWSSADGVGWGWLGIQDPVFQEPGYQGALGVVRVGARIVAVGRHGAGSAGLWVGPTPPTFDPNDPNAPGP